MKRGTPSASYREQMALLESSPVIHTAEEVDRAIDQMAIRIDLQLHTAAPVLVTVMQGGLYLAGHLLARLRFPLIQDSLQVSRYGDATTGKTLRWIAPLNVDVRGRTVLLIDDVLDEGVTLGSVVTYLLEQGAQKVLTAVLVRKETARTVGAGADFIGLESGTEYLFGCGMDCRGYWRNLPEIRALREPELHAPELLEGEEGA
jgi:hypoxanthine phosphoribosyltransferase